MQMCQLGSDHDGRHTLRRNRSTFITGAPMKEYRHASNKGLLLKGLRSAPSFLSP